MFKSQFRDGSAIDFPLRHYLRCREDFFSGIIHFILQIVFLVVVVLFGKTFNSLFINHGADLNPWYRIISLVLLGFFALLVLRRVVYKGLELRELKMEMSELKAQFRQE